MRAKILNAITYIVAFIFMVACCALDSNTYIPHIVAITSWGFLMLRAQREGLFEQRGHHYGK